MFRRLAGVGGLAIGLGWAGLFVPATSFAYPANSTPPAITGTAHQGQTLTENHGTWIPDPTSSTYQWLRCNGSGEGCVSISGATAQAYALIAADAGHELRVEETAKYFIYSESAQSAATAVVVPNVPEDTVLPTITGTAQQGQTLTDSNGTWTNSPTSYSYEWQRCNASGEGCAPISGAAAQAYVLQSEDAGHELRVKEIAGNAGGSGSPAESAATAVVLPSVPEKTGLPTITGTAQQGQTLTENHGTWTNSPTSYSYEWQRCNASGEGCAPISGATAQAYVLQSEDAGHELRVKEIAGNAGGSGSPAESAATAVVLPPVPESTSPPTITGTAQLGQTLTEAHGSWLYSPTSYTYQWQRCDSSGEGCVWISGATAQTYVPVAADLGHKLRVDETASNAGGSSDPASQATAVVGAPAQMVTSVFTSLLSSSHPALGDPPARVVLSVRSVTVKRNGVAVIPLGCPASAVGGCRGRITITIHIVEPHARRAGAARCARGCRPLAGANYEARAGQRIRVRVHIASFGRQLLTNRRSVHVTLTATSVADGQTATVTRAITLRRA